MKTKLILDVNKTQYAQLNSIVTGRVGDKVSNVVDVYVIDGGIPYNLTGLKVFFECAKPDNTVIRDDNGVKMIDVAKGHFEYTFPPETFGAIGKAKQAFMSIEKDKTIRATTQDFVLVTLPDATSNRIPSESYLSDLDKLIQELNEMALEEINSQAAAEATAAKDFASQANELSISIQKQLNETVINGDSSVEAAQARVDKNGDVYQTLKDRIDAEQKKNEKQGITCEDLGLIPNTISASSGNIVKLINAINNGHKILVDNLYYLDTNNIAITKQVELLGINMNAEFKLNRHTSSSTLLRIDGNHNINIEQIGFTNEGTEVIQIMSTATITPGRWYMDKFNFKGNSLKGSIGVIYAFNDNTINPLINKMGFGEFVFTKNILRGIDKVSCVNLFDTPGIRFTLTENIVTNFSNNLFNISITNDKPFERQFFDAIDTLIVKGNIITCEDNFWPNNTGGYYTFVLFEGTKCIFENNTISGMKSKQANLSLYDSYLSCNHVEYRNNTIKNNILFRADKTENTLIKSKEGGFDEKPGTRIYENNSYIVEKTFIEKHGLLTEGWVYMLDLTSVMKEYKLINNSFNVYEFRFMSPTNNQEFGDITFAGNSIKCDIASQSIFNIRLNNNTPRSINFRNNNIKVGTGTFHLVRMTQQGNYSADYMVINDNTVLGNATVCNTCYSKETVVNNNTVICTEDTILFYLGDLGEVTKLNNMFKMADSTKKLTMSRLNRSFNNTLDNNTYLLRMDNNNNQGIQIAKIDKQNKKITYYVGMDINYIDGIQSMDYSFSYGYDSTGDYNYIEYLDTAGILQKVNLSTGSTSIEIKTTNKTSITRAKIHIVFNPEGVNIRPASGVLYATHVNQKISTVIQ